MKRALPILFSFAVFMAPIAASAVTYVNSNVQSTSDSGGNVVGSGGTVSTGPSSASSYVQTSISGNNNYDYESSGENVSVTNTNGNATATVNIETDTDGKVQSQTITKTIPPGEQIDINVGTSSGNVVRVAARVSNATSGTTSLSHALDRLLRVASQLSASSTAISSSTLVITNASGTPSLSWSIGVFFHSFFSMFRFW